METQYIVIIALTLAVTVIFCGLPVAIAAIRRHPDLGLIAKLSPLSILSFALWFALIVWAATDKRKDGVVSRYIDKVKDKNLLPWIVGALVVLGLAGATLPFLLQ